MIDRANPICDVSAARDPRICRTPMHAFNHLNLSEVSEERALWKKLASSSLTESETRRLRELIGRRVYPFYDSANQGAA